VKGDRTPSFGQNLAFFLNYQLGAMFWKIFSVELHGQGRMTCRTRQLNTRECPQRNKIFDSMWLGNRSIFLKPFENKGRNEFFALPLILGLIGLFYHYKKDNKDAWVVMLLFF